MTHLNSAVKLLDRAAEKFNDKIAISDEWSEISFSELQRKGKAVGTALAKTTPQGYMPAPVMVYLKKSISCLVCFMGADVQCKSVCAYRLRYACEQNTENC